MLWLKNVNIVDPSQELFGLRDVWVEDGVIKKISLPENRTEAAVENIEMVDGEGKFLFPGLIDVHVHLREPGFEEKENIASGAAAAIRGGITGILAMPNTKPVIDQRGLVEFVRHQGERAQMARVYPIAAITKGSQGEELTEMHDLVRGGAVAFSDDGQPVSNAELMRLALQYAQVTGAVVISHCEDKNLAREGVIHLGNISSKLGLRGIPSSSESVMVARDVILAGETGGKLHIAHVSTEESVALIRRAKKQGINVTAEVNPHHLIFCDEDLTLSATSLKVNPPLRSKKDREALLNGLLDGTIDMLATDHAPHTWEEKTKPIAEAPFGINALEMALPAVWQHLVEPGLLTVKRLVEAWSMAPARRFQLPGGSLKVGEAADMVLFDPEAAEVIQKETLVSRAANTPFLGKELKGMPVMVWRGGKLVQKNRKLV